MPDSVLDAAPRPDLLGADDLRGRPEADAARAQFQRERAWEAAFTLAETRTATLISIIADANRCSAEARR